MLKQNLCTKLRISTFLVFQLKKKMLKKYSIYRKCHTWLFTLVVAKVNSKLTTNNDIIPHPYHKFIHETFYKVFKRSSTYGMFQLKPSKLKKKTGFLIIISHILFCGCDIQPLTIEGVMDKTENSTYVIISQSDFPQKTIIEDSIKNVEFVDIKLIDTIQLNKILGFSSGKRILIFNSGGYMILILL